VSESPALIYLEADDEITAVVRRVRAADAGRVVIVAPGRSRATSSAVALRLLARAGEEGGRELAIVGDALTRSLAAEAGLAAFATVDEARRAEPGEALPVVEPRHAAINVIRGSATDDTVATPVVAGDDELTRAVPVTRPGVPAPRPRRRRRKAAAAVVALVAVLLVSVVAGATILPAATITISPRSDAIGPVPDVFAVTDVERISGTVTETATVTATETYEVEVAATGRVTFFNFNFFDVVVPAESLVATGREAGDQAYLTDEAITVPAGTFDPVSGGITAGERSVGVTAAVIGPDGNVAAAAIDTVLDRNLEGQLRGFPSIREPLVTNPEATSGGRDESGPEITDEDVQSASRSLTDALREAAAEAMAGSESLVFADLPEPIQPEIEGLDELIGRRDAETVEIRGSLTYDRVTADPTAVEVSAVDRFRAELPEGWQLVEGSTRVEFGEVLRAGEELSVKVTVSGRVAPIIDRAEILDRIVGRTADEAALALADIGAATVDLWPGWVATVPATEWRIDLRVVEP